MQEKNQLFARIRLTKFLVLLVAFMTVGGFIFAARHLPAQEETDVETCATCHEDWAEEFSGTPHAQTRHCTACHGLADLHLETGGEGTIFAFKDIEPVLKKNQVCLSCHSDDSPVFFAGPHGKSAMDCISCHSIHYAGKGPKLLKQQGNENCSICHQDVMAKFEFSERHRLREGILDCVTCHDPHGPSPRQQLAGFKHQACLQCHTDKSGPFLHEHEALRIEGCTVCHDVHGSPNRHMLIYQSVSDLCFSCHTLAPSWHSGFDSRTTNCVTCHSTIHGSNLSPIFLK